jgi:hypothetical protein
MAFWHSCDTAQTSAFRATGKSEVAHLGMPDIRITSGWPTKMEVMCDGVQSRADATQDLHSVYVTKVEREPDPAGVLGSVGNIEVRGACENNLKDMSLHVTTTEQAKNCTDEYPNGFNYPD